MLGPVHEDPTTPVSQRKNNDSNNDPLQGKKWASTCNVSQRKLGQCPCHLALQFPRTSWELLCSSINSTLSSICRTKAHRGISLKATDIPKQR